MALSELQQPQTAQRIIRTSERATLQNALQDSSPPVLIHLNADTTWLLSLPYPPSSQPPAGRSRFNILLDPWLQGPQSDVASWFSTQWHIVTPCIETIEELNQILAEAEQGGASNESQYPLKCYIDVVTISHEFTDHCHEATLKELRRDVPVFATEKAAELIRSWKHFSNVTTTPGFSSSTKDWQRVLSVSPLPEWVGIGRVITAGNALYYHSAVMLVFRHGTKSQAVIYSPHGIKGSDLQAVQSVDIETLALLHGLHDVRIWMTKQLNLGALNGLEAVRASGARYWIATHDEIKKGGGFIAPMLRRTKYTVADAVKKKTQSLGEEAPNYNFVELGSGDGLVLA
ncbi:hypothetical protein JX266_001258 [Neoarthrinium moseri]|uniref:uncharacterized protein n=1 Tax=Neoarthrinium moseri TaxID=1658444 RepID=UPI001FDAE25B|nr:uncharacterized protein JN550_002305 [Neoarthrinium moseri]KAI1854117.1 hypothetical protein JX266_001258 [Neoarthrinium moseri]KAI1874876.1 hypothetical protein JN550_002305 [Neoarthrinium moseri]